MRTPSFQYVIGPLINHLPSEAIRDGIIIVRDIGPHDVHPTITNDPESVVEKILKNFPETKKIYYYDTEGILDELKFKDGKFTDFAPGPIKT